jgi:hypothetical protein
MENDLPDTLVCISRRITHALVADAPRPSWKVALEPGLSISTSDQPGGPTLDLTLKASIMRVFPRSLGCHMVTVRMRDHRKLRGGIRKRQFNQAQLSVVRVLMLAAQ